LYILNGSDFLKMFEGLLVCVCELGEGIHHAMEAGKMAAGFIGECLDRGNFDAEVMSIWHERWMDKFGNDYRWYIHVIICSYAM